MKINFFFGTNQNQLYSDILVTFNYHLQRLNLKDSTAIGLKKSKGYLYIWIYEAERTLVNMMKTKSGLCA